MKATILAMIILLALPISVIAYDKARPTEEIPTEFDDAFSYVRVVTFGTAVGMYRNEDGYRFKETFFNQAGSGFVVKDGYAVTCAHVVYPDKVNTNEGKWTSRTTESFKVVNQIIVLYDVKTSPIVAEIFYIDRELDVAILKYEPIGILEALPYRIEYYPGMIQAEDLVCGIVHDRDENMGLEGYVHRQYGFILNPEPITPTGKGVSWFNPFDMTLFMTVFPGDSGSPLFAFRDGEPVIIGMIRALTYDPITGIPYAYAVRLPNVMRFIEADGD